VRTATQRIYWPSATSASRRAGFTEAQVKALAATYNVADPDADGGKRKASPRTVAGPDQSAADLRLVRHRAAGLFGDRQGAHRRREVPNWVWNTSPPMPRAGRTTSRAAQRVPGSAPQGVEVPAGAYYNKIFPAHFLKMPPPLTDDRSSISRRRRREGA